MEEKMDLETQRQVKRMLASKTECPKCVGEIYGSLFTVFVIYHGLTMLFLWVSLYR